MFDSSPIVVGLDIGTSKVCAVVGEISEAGALNLIGVGQARSRGIRKGEIVDAKATCEDIRNAVVEAEQMADAEVRSVYLGVTGAHMRCFNNRGFHPVASHDREIAEEDLQDVVKNAKAIHLPSDNRVVHMVRQHFRVDDQEGIVNPIGMFGARVEVDVHVVHGNLNRLQNPIRGVKSLQLEVDDIVFTGLASSLALLNNEQKELGALVIDIGSGTTEYVVYADGVIKQTGVLAVGGDHVTNDLAYGLKAPLGRAEELKLRHGAALVSPEAKGRKVPASPELGLTEKAVNLDHLQQIMSLRLEEIFQLIAEELEQLGLLEHLRAGILLCGGTARTPGILRLAENVFGLPAVVGSASAVSGSNSALDQPEFATAIGLVKFGSFEHRKRMGRRVSLARGIRSKFTQFFRMVQL